MTPSMKKLCALFLFFLIPTVSLAESHKLIHAYRSGSEIYVSQSLEGEYGPLAMINAGENSEGLKSEMWRGYGFRNSTGIEIMKFIQLGVSHTFLNLRSKESRLQSLSGSRLTGDMKFAFVSPVGNLEMGGGPTILRLDYQNEGTLEDFIGNGYYYALGVNYFLTSRLSLSFYGRTFRESLVRSGGDESIEGAISNTRGLSMGAKIWL